jgi:hypothetical protein
MAEYYKEFLVYEGEYFSVYFHSTSHGISEVNEYFESCDAATQASLLYLAKRISGEGIIYDETKFHIEDKRNKIYCFKPRAERFFCFFCIDKRIIITSAHTKKRQKLDRRELNKAIKIRDMYYKG